MAATQIGNLKVGDVIQYNVGYSMVLPKFAIIESFTESGKSARVRLLSNTIVSSDAYGQSGMVVPNLDSCSGYGTYRLKKGYRDEKYVFIERHYSRKWDGTPEMYDYLD